MFIETHVTIKYKIILLSSRFVHCSQISLKKKKYLLSLGFVCRYLLQLTVVIYNVPKNYRLLKIIRNYLVIGTDGNRPFVLFTIT